MNVQQARAAHRITEERLRPEETHLVEVACISCMALPDVDPTFMAEAVEGIVTTACPLCGCLNVVRA